MTDPENAADVSVLQEERAKAEGEAVPGAGPVAEAPPLPDVTVTVTATTTATGTAADVQSQATVAEAEAAATTTTTTKTKTTTTKTDAKDAPSSPQTISSSDEDVRPEPEPFVNNGLKKWQTAREEWCRKRKSTDPESAHDGQISNRPKAASAIPIDVDGVIDVLFDPRWRGGSVVAGQRAKMSLQPPRFPTNVPLPQMIDVLTDLWEAEGLDV